MTITASEAMKQPIKRRGILELLHWVSASR
jgi:hypothetical protein